LAVTLAACGNSSSEETTEAEEVTVETEETEEASEEPELVTTEFRGMTFSYPAGCAYTEDEDSATITLEQGTIAATILVQDLSDMGDLTDAYVAMAPSSLLSAYDNVSNREDYDTTLGGLEAKGVTAIVEMEGVWASYLALCAYDPDTLLLYDVAVMERSGAEHTDYVDLFIDSISFGKEDAATEEAATEEAANEEPAEEVEAVPSDYQSALKQAESYSSRMHMSKQGIFDQLTSDYGGQFSDEAAQYAIDNVNADWNANALASAESYSNNMHMSKQGVYDQLTSEHGEKFTADEAQYAVDNMEADWNANALEKAKSYRDNMNMSPDAIHDQLTSEHGEQFTQEEADYAIANLG
ncbi:MAG: Ltp family lipoprotein, partial [Bacteroidales bacterium]|nr:Ltp family lipoprotein [Bacteroidales bacterium]